MGGFPARFRIGSGRFRGQGSGQDRGSGMGSGRVARGFRAGSGQRFREVAGSVLRRIVAWVLAFVGFWAGSGPGRVRVGPCLLSASSSTIFRKPCKSRASDSESRTFAMCAYVRTSSTRPRPVKRISLSFQQIWSSMPSLFPKTVLQRLTFGFQGATTHFSRLGIASRAVSASLVPMAPVSKSPNPNRACEAPNQAQTHFPRPAALFMLCSP